MKRRVRILGRAERDLREIQRYIVRDSPEAADPVVDALLEAIESLDRFPLRGAIPRDERLKALNFRYLVSAPYLIFYKVLRSDVRIYRVLHAKRAYQDLL